MTTQSRRAVLGAAAAALASGSVVNLAAIVAAKADIGVQNTPISDPIFHAIERHWEKYVAVNSLPVDTPNDISDAHVAELNTLTAALVSMPLVDRSATAAILRYINGFIEDADIGLEDRAAFIDRVANAIEHMAVQS